MSIFHRLNGAWAATLLAALGLVGCSPGPSESLINTEFPAQSPAGNVLRKSNGAEPQTLDPHKAEGVPAANILRDLYEGLIIEAPNGDLLPGVAENWQADANGMRYTFQLRADAKWSNGDALTAEDFVYSLRRAVDPNTLSRYANILYTIKNAEAVNRGELALDSLGVEALTPQLLQITLEAPTPYFLALLTHTMAYPVHRLSVEAVGDQFTRPGNNVSNGAYQMSAWLVQSHIDIERNDNYWNNAATRIDRVVYLALENPDAVLKRYRANELDMTQEAPARQLDWIKDNLANEYTVAPYLGAYYYGLNTLKAPFKDSPELRRALALSIDRQILTKKLTAGGEVAAYSFVQPVAGYTPQLPEWANWTQAERNTEARRLYAEAGYSTANQLEVEVLYNTSQGHKQIAIAVASMWKQTLGVKTTLRSQEWKVYLQTRANKTDTEIYRSGWIGDYNDAYAFLQLLISDNAQNDSGYNNPQFDRLLKQASREIDLAQRARYLQQAEALMLQDMPVIPIYFYVSKHLIKPWVKGFTPNIMDHVYSKDLWIVQGNPSNPPL